MLARLSVVVLLCLGWTPTMQADPLATPLSPAAKAFRQGQLAMEADRFEEAIRQFELTLRLDPQLVTVRLSLAAAHLALGQEDQAEPHMRAYLNVRPEHFLVRMPYAELLLKLDRPKEALAELERFTAEVQNHPELAEEHLIGCHTRLMEVADRIGDEYLERLNRGIGLYLLATKRAELGGKQARQAEEELLCKAAGELTLARVQRPDEARPSWYLRGVWNRLGQRQPADRSLRETEQRVGLSTLTPAEVRDLWLATRVREIEQSKR